MIKEYQQNNLLIEAQNVAKNAYAHYSGIFVGAALMTTTGNVYEGCNVENSSYPLTMCAERNAVAAAVTTEGPAVKITAIAVVSFKDGSEFPITPCGACRQVISEFSEDCIVIYLNENGEKMIVPIKELLPDAFSLKMKV